MHKNARGQSVFFTYYLYSTFKVRGIARGCLAQVKLLETR